MSALTLTVSTMLTEILRNRDKEAAVVACEQIIETALFHIGVLKSIHERAEYLDRLTQRDVDSIVKAMNRQNGE